MNKDDKKLHVPPILNISAMVKRAEEMYESKKNEIEPVMNGKFIAIEVDSGEHFIADTREEAVTKVKEKYPNKIPLTRKIGEIEKASRHLSYPRRKYALC
jgi:hypothetical protein